MVVADLDIMIDMNTWEPEKAMIKGFNEMNHWLVRNFNLEVKRRKIDITDKNPGAIFGDDPKIIFVKALRRATYFPKGTLLEKVCVARVKFNDALNDAVYKHDNNIMNITACNLPSHYDSKAKLTVKGKEAFWQEFDHLMERFDRGDIQLLLSKSGQYSHKQQPHGRKFKQPTHGHTY